MVNFQLVLDSIKQYGIGTVLGAVLLVILAILIRMLVKSNITIQYNGEK